MLIIRHITHTPLSVWCTFSSLTQNPCGTGTYAPGCQSQSPDHSLLEMKRTIMNMNHMNTHSHRCTDRN